MIEIATWDDSLEYTIKLKYLKLSIKQIGFGLYELHRAGVSQPRDPRILFYSWPFPAFFNFNFSLYIVRLELMNFTIVNDDSK